MLCNGQDPVYFSESLEEIRNCFTYSILKSRRHYFWMVDFWRWSWSCQYVSRIVTIMFSLNIFPSFSRRSPTSFRPTLILNFSVMQQTNCRRWGLQITVVLTRNIHPHIRRAFTSWCVTILQSCNLAAPLIIALFCCYCFFSWQPWGLFQFILH